MRSFDISRLLYCMIRVFKHSSVAEENVQWRKAGVGKEPFCIFKLIVS